MLVWVQELGLESQLAVLESVLTLMLQLVSLLRWLSLLLLVLLSVLVSRSTLLHPLRCLADWRARHCQNQSLRYPEACQRSRPDLEYWVLYVSGGGHHC